MEEEQTEQEKPKKVKKEKAPSRLYFTDGHVSTEDNHKGKKAVEYITIKEHEKALKRLIEDFRGIMVEFSSCIKSKVQNEKIKSTFDSIISKY